MPLDRIVLIIVCVVIAAGATIWLGVFLLAALTLPLPALLLLLLPVALVVWLVWRVIADRLANREDDHYDQIEK